MMMECSFSCLFCALRFKIIFEVEVVKRVRAVQIFLSYNHVIHHQGHTIVAKHCHLEARQFFFVSIVWNLKKEQKMKMLF
jgi:hypothetical protein